MQNSNHPRTCSYKSHSICIPQLKLTATPDSRVFQTIADSPPDVEIGIHSPLHIKNYNGALKEATSIQTYSHYRK